MTPFARGHIFLFVFCSSLNLELPSTTSEILRIIAANWQYYNPARRLREHRVIWTARL